MICSLGCANEIILLTRNDTITMEASSETLLTISYSDLVMMLLK